MFCWLLFGTTLALLGHFDLEGLTLHVQSLSILYCGVTIYLVSNINCGLFNYVHVFCIVQSCILKLTNFKFGSNVNNRMYNLINHIVCFGTSRRRLI
jgi:hypothetical protein